MCEAQYGFHKGRGTTDPIFILTQIVLDANKKSKAVFSCLVDQAKGFDSINLELLGTCWLKFKDVTYTSIVYSNANSIHVVYFNNLYSKPYPHSKGVRQGCNLRKSITVQFYL